MIQEIINYTKHLKENSPMLFEQNLEPSKGLHVFVKLDKKGNAINFPGEKGVDWDYYDGENMSSFLKNIIPFEQESKRIGTRMDKVLDTGKVEGSKKFQIFSCSPYIISFKKQSFNLIGSRLNPFFENAIEVCLDNDDEIAKKKVIIFKNIITSLIEEIKLLKVKAEPSDLYSEEKSFFETMKNDFFVNIYYKNILFSEYKKAHQRYLKQKLFNTNDYNSDKTISNETFGLSGFINGLNMKKPFLEHKTASMYKGIAGRIQAKDTVILNYFDLLLKRKPKIFPSPLPIFIDKNEFKKSEEILKIFMEDGKLTYSQILKKIFKSNNELVLQNYYLLFFNYKYELEDFDFVSKFRYSLKENDKYPKIKNLFELKHNKEIKPSREIKNIFQFEANIIKIIFNQFLVGGSIDSNYFVNYFGEIKPDKKLYGEKISAPIYQMILKYRKAFYDYIYKSKTQAINSLMWDEIMWNSIIGDLRNTNFDKKYFIEQSIKEKLNIWFSLYNFFKNDKERTDMASKIPELLEKMKEVANNDNQHFETTEEFAFGAGQVIYFLLNKSKASEKTHALLEPFIQKVKAEPLQNSIAQTINAYKHEINFGKGRFERLSAEVLGYETHENLKSFQRLLLAGYFAVPVIYEKKDKKENKND